MSLRPPPFISAAQIRAARALLDWSQDDLAEISGLSVATIRKIELGHISPRSETTGSIIAAFENALIEFILPTGVRLKDGETMVIEGDEPYSHLMDDIFHAVKGKGGEVLFMYVDNALASESQVARQVEIRREGAKFRFLAEEGNTYMHYPLEEYRWIPKRFYLGNVQIVYANKVAICLYGGKTFTKVKKVVVIESAPLAESVRNLFEFVWENCRKPTFSTASRIFK